MLREEINLEQNSGVNLDILLLYHILLIFKKNLGSQAKFEYITISVIYDCNVYKKNEGHMIYG